MHSNLGTIKVIRNLKGCSVKHEYCAIYFGIEILHDAWHQQKYNLYLFLALVVECCLNSKQLKWVSQAKQFFLALKVGFLDIFADLRKLRLLKIYRGKVDLHC